MSIIVGTLELSKDETDRIKKIVVRTDDGSIQIMISDIVGLTGSGNSKKDGTISMD